MTVFVDNYRVPATVRGIRSRWSHLSADTKPELMEFALSIGLKESWWQTCKRTCGRDGEECVHWHFDVTDAKRDEAIAAGARAIDIREFGEIVRERRAAMRATEVSA